MFRLLLVVGLVWLALLPPVFTAGACTAEYEAATGLLQANRPQISTPEAALQFLQTQALQPSLLSAEDCARSKPRFLRQCGSARADGTSISTAGELFCPSGSVTSHAAAIRSVFASASRPASPYGSNSSRISAGDFTYKSRG